MRIGIDIRALLTPYRTGVGEYTAELLNALFRHDTTNEYYLFSNSLRPLATQNTWHQPNVRHTHTRFPNKIFSTAQRILNAPALDTLIAKHAGIPKLDYFFSPHFNFTALSPSAKHLLTIHDLTYTFFPEHLTLRQRLWHRAIAPEKQCQKAYRIFTPSENTKRDIVEYYHIPENKITVLYPGLTVIENTTNEQIVKQKYNLPDKYVLFLGTTEPRKNITALITAFELAHHSESTARNLHLVIAGAPGWKNAALKKIISRSPVQNQIHFLGHIPATDKKSLFKLARVFAYPSIYEGFGFPVLESMAYGTPVITSSRSSLSEITAGAAYLVNPHRPEEIADGIITLATTSETHELYKNLGLEQAKKFNWEKTAREWLANITN